jgi:alpha-D-xyloside xylohydrolase
MLYYDKLRYRLMPYIYSMAGKIWQDGYTIMRGLVMDFGADTAVQRINDQYMFGPALLINPVYEPGAQRRQVYLPATCGWYDFYSNQYYSGGQRLAAAAPADRIPLFVKEGSIIPFGPAIQYSTEKAADTIALYVYTGKDAHFSLYEDENDNYNYENGAWATIAFDYNEQTKELIIGNRSGSFNGMLQNRTFIINWIKKNGAAALNLDQQTGSIVPYAGKKTSIKMK